ncbi:hypothetical protein HaLaN_15782, partial [Haematococcus lacustris]
MLNDLAMAFKHIVSFHGSYKLLYLLFCMPAHVMMRSNISWPHNSRRTTDYDVLVLVQVATPPIEPPTPLAIRDNGFSGLISARIYTRIEASECCRAEPHAELVGHAAGHTTGAERADHAPKHAQAVAGQGHRKTACACAQCMTPAPRGVCMRPSITKPFVAMPMFDQKRDDKHWDDECLTLLCSFAPDSVMQLCTLGKKLSVKMLNEYCKAVGLYVPANTLRADLRYMVLQHLNEQAECD